MTPDDPNSLALRRRADALATQSEAGAPQDDTYLSRELIQKTLHELRVHQIELEIQNEELRLAKDLLDASRARYVDLYDLAPVGYCSVNAVGIITQANLTLATLLGVARTALVNQPFSGFLIREDQDRWYQLRRALLLGRPVESAELRLRRDAGTMGSTGACLWAQVTTTLAQDEAGKLLLHMAVSDITERKQAEAKLQASEESYRALAQDMPLFVSASLPDGTLTYVNSALAAVVGLTAQDVVGHNIAEYLSANDRPLVMAQLSALTPIHDVETHEQCFVGANGQPQVHQWTNRAFFDRAGRMTRVQAVGQDITLRKAHQHQLERIAHFDALTNLPNRVLLADRLQQAVTQSTRRGDTLAVAYLDLDGFKSVNDHYGHDVGDRLLVALATNMKDALRDGDTMARIGGDEFVAVFTDLTHPQAALPLLTRLLEAAAQPILVDDISVQVSASLGVTFYPQAQPVEADQLLRQADQAMYQAKMAGRNRYHLFDALQDNDLRIHHEDLQHIQQALERHEFVLHYQPKVNMRSGRVIGAEALIRWQHPKKGLLAPSAFLHVIEEHPLAVAIGEWVIDTALSQIERWRSAGLDLPVSVNIGARQLQQGDFVERLQSILATHPLIKPSCLELEILETSALKDMAQVSSVIAACEQIGIAFALDDFGTGYSSLTYLKRLHVATLKIHQSFVHGMLQDADDRSILQGVIGLASAFKRGVIAEGVETIAHGTALLQLGCDLAQGYGIARPMPADQLPTWVVTWINGPNPFA